MKKQLHRAAQQRIEAKYNKTEPPDEDNRWRRLVSPDIVEFIDRVPLSPHDHFKILQNPHLFFSRPKNVPLNLRKQVLLYERPQLACAEIDR